ncbi:MAG: hypothetical protein Q7U64_05235 [Desulfocapsaceae bacterium]|nr:hypothetical protein [Desulfocapsaceae bacterium]
MPPLESEGLRLAYINAFTAVPAIERYRHAVYRTESQRAPTVTQAAGCASVMLHPDPEFASGAYEIQGCPQGTEVAAIKSPGHQVYPQHQQENHSFQGQGVKKRPGS